MMVVAFRLEQPKSEFSREDMTIALRGAITDHIREYAAGTNVNPRTLLTTD